MKTIDAALFVRYSFHMDEKDFYDSLPKKRMAAGVLFLDEEANILIVKPDYQLYWLLPGGVVEADESPRQASMREVQEELHLDVVVTRLLCVDYLSQNGNISETIHFVFYGGILRAEQIASIALAVDELEEYRFVQPQVAQTLLSPPLAKKILACIQALQQHTTALLENGEVVV